MSNLVDQLTADDTYLESQAVLAGEQERSTNLYQDLTETNRQIARVDELEATVQSLMNQGGYDHPTHVTVMDELETVASEAALELTVMEAGVESFQTFGQRQAIATYALETAQGFRARLRAKAANALRVFINQHTNGYRQRAAISGKYRALIQKEIERLKKREPTAKGTIRFTDTLSYVMYGSEELDVNQARRGMDELVKFQTDLNEHLGNLTKKLLGRVNGEQDLFEAAKLLREGLVPKNLFIPDGEGEEDQVKVKRWKLKEPLIGSMMIYINNPKDRAKSERQLVSMLKACDMYSKPALLNRSEIKEVKRPQADTYKDWIDAALQALTTYDTLLENDTRFWDKTDEEVKRMTQGEENRYQKLSAQITYYALVNRDPAILTAASRLLSGMVSVLKNIK